MRAWEKETKRHESLGRRAFMFDALIDTTSCNLGSTQDFKGCSGRSRFLQGCGMKPSCHRIIALVVAAIATEKGYQQRLDKGVEMHAVKGVPLSSSVSEIEEMGLMGLNLILECLVSLC